MDLQRNGEDAAPSSEGFGRSSCIRTLRGSQEQVEGVVRLKLYKGSARVVGRRSAKSLYCLGHVKFEEDAVSCTCASPPGGFRVNPTRFCRGLEP